MNLRRMFCLLCTVLVIAWTVPAYPDTAAESSRSFEFDLTFHLNAASFPELLRARVEGYSSLVNRLGIRGTVSWSTATQSADMEATLYYTDNPSLSYPFRLYGTQSRVFLTSPLINNEVILLNMAALMEFSMKARNTLGVPLSYAALLYPYATVSAFQGMADAWQSVIGTFAESGEVSTDQLRTISDLWADEIQNNGILDWWITALASGSDDPSAVETEMSNLPYYILTATGEQQVSVSVATGSEIWRNASGDTLFSRRETDASSSVVLSLPADENGYEPFYSLICRNNGRFCSVEAAASLIRDPSSVSDSNEEWYAEDEYVGDEVYGDEGEYEDEDDYESSRNFPDLLLDFRADGTGFPLAFPDDADFSLNVTVLGALYPDFSLSLRGITKKDGAFTLSLNKPLSSDSAQVEIFRCSGTFLPAASPKDVPDYMREDLENVFNVFSINETIIPDFNSQVLSPLIRNILSFVTVAPTSACQSFLDDLTDIGLLDMLLD